MYKCKKSRGDSCLFLFVRKILVFFSLEWFGIFILALFFPRILLTGGFLLPILLVKSKNFSTEKCSFFGVFCSHNFSEGDIHFEGCSFDKRFKNKKFSWIFNVLRAIERVGRPFCLERRFDWSVFLGFLKRTGANIEWKGFYFYMWKRCYKKTFSNI